MYAQECGDEHLARTGEAFDVEFETYEGLGLDRRPVHTSLIVAHRTQLDAIGSPEG